MHRNRLAKLAALAALTGCQLVGYNAFEAVELTDAGNASTVREETRDAGTWLGDDGEVEADGGPQPLEFDAASPSTPSTPERDGGVFPPFDRFRDASIFRRDGGGMRRDARVDERPDASSDASMRRDAAGPIGEPPGDGGEPVGPGGNGPGGGPGGGMNEECVGEERCRLECARRPDQLCELGCSDVGQCELSCSGNQDCAVLCDQTRDCRPVCGQASSCFIGCLDTQRCRPRCVSGSMCAIDCAGSDCRNVECAPGARCYLMCRNDSPCSFAACSGEVVQCGRMLVCGARCPEPPEERPSEPRPMEPRQ